MRADIESVYDWIREPDNAEFFSYGELLEWVEQRPISLVLSAKHEIKSLTNEFEAQATLITELVGALDDALDDLNTDIRWADGGQLEGLIERRTKLESVITKAKDQTNDR